MAARVLMCKLNSACLYFFLCLLANFALGPLEVAHVPVGVATAAAAAVAAAAPLSRRPRCVPVFSILPPLPPTQSPLLVSAPLFFGRRLGWAAKKRKRVSSCDDDDDDYDTSYYLLPLLHLPASLGRRLFRRVGPLARACCCPAARVSCTRQPDESSGARTATWQLF